jgi:Ricin-type beta-trefoil lectin domain-like
VFSINIDKEGRWIAGFSLGVVIAGAFAVSLQIHGQAQVQTQDDVVNLVSAASGKCLQPVNQSHNQGDAIVQQTCNGSAAQQWTVHAVSSGKFHVINKDSGQCLDARGKAEDGTPVQQWPCNEITNENWGRGTGNLLVSEVSNTSSHCVATSGNQDGLAMTLRKCNNDPSEIWKTEHASASACSGRSGNSPLDLTWTDCDPNGFPLNPAFVYQVNNGGRVPQGGPTGVCPAATSSHQFPSSCVSFPVTYDSCPLCGPHVNYFAVTYQGPVTWWQKSAWYADDDYNFFMDTPNNAGEFLYPPGAGVPISPPKPEQVEIEFDSRETINYFRSPLWTNFHNMVDNNNSAAEAYITDKTAVVTSLFGFDCGHSSCGSEEHPAYAMALDMNDSNLSDDQWGVFARNWGNEGFCSNQVHTLPVNDLKVLIPWLPGATAVAVVTSNFNLFGSTAEADSLVAAEALAAAENATKLPKPQITVANGQGILIDFTLANTSFKVGAQTEILEMGWEGEVHLQWTVPPAARSTLAARRAAASKRPEEEEEERPEDRIASLFARIPAQQQTAIQARVLAPFATQPAVNPPTSPMPPVRTVATLPAPPRLARPVVPQSVNSPRLAQRIETVRQAVCGAYKNSVPGYPAICAASAAPAKK